MRTVCGTPLYTAQEILEQQRQPVKGGKRIGYGPKCDLWSAGVMLYEMLCGMHPLQDGSGRKLGHYISPTAPDAGKRAPLRFSNTVSPQAIDLVNSLLTHEEERLTAEQVLAHVWLSGQSTDVTKKDMGDNKMTRQDTVISCKGKGKKRLLS